MTILEPMRAEAIEAPGRTVTASAVDVGRTRTRTRT
ncbi:MAG: hypothetical protein JWM12_1041, partial [Ilumatobacteraceae bacterium]|nr:hypothetical protein [Ilumatobacteraceae bacterium]